MVDAEGPRLKTGLPSSGRGWCLAGGRRARQLWDPEQVSESALPPPMCEAGGQLVPPPRPVGRGRAGPWGCHPTPAALWW